MRGAFFLVAACFCAFANAQTMEFQEMDPAPQADTASNDSVTLSDIDKRVRVVTTYRPSVSDAFKINSLPQVQDTVSVSPTFEYSIVSVPIETEYNPEQIQAASMKGEPLDKLYKALATVGAGNYTTFLGDVKVNSLRSKEQQVGFQLHHYSSSGKIKLDDDEKYPAGYSTTFARFNGKKFIDDKVVFGDVNLQRDGYKQYGFYTAKKDSTLDKKDISQRYLMGDVKAGIASNSLDSSSLQYSFSAKYGVTQEMEKYAENAVGATVEVTKYIDQKAGGVELQGGYYGTSGNGLDSAQYGYIDATPWASLRVDQMRIKAGVGLVNVFGYDKFFIYPKINFSYYSYDDIVVPYIQLDGDCKLNTYREISMENPYIYSGLQVKPTNTKLRFIGGVRGKLGKDMPFNISGSYADVKDQYLFVNEIPLTDSMQNKFVVIYDDMKVANVHAEVGAKQGERIDLLLKGDYWHYTMGNEAQAWHLPTLEIGVAAKYNIQNKIIAGAELVYSGERKAKSSIEGISEYSLKPVVDANIGLEYRYTKILSAFLQLNNIAAQNYNRWNLYPSKRFNVLLGVTYAL